MLSDAQESLNLYIGISLSILFILDIYLNLISLAIYLIYLIKIPPLLYLDQRSGNAQVVIRNQGETQLY